MIVLNCEVVTQRTVKLKFYYYYGLYFKKLTYNCKGFRM